MSKIVVILHCCLFKYGHLDKGGVQRGLVNYALPDGEGTKRYSDVDVSRISKGEEMSVSSRYSSTAELSIWEQLKQIEQGFSEIKMKKSPTDKYTCIINRLESLVKIGRTTLPSVEIKKRYIMLVSGAFQRMCEHWAHNYLMIPLLSLAKEMAISVGDNRSVALCDFQLSVIQLIFDEQRESEISYNRGWNIANQLGDTEILDIAALYSIPFYSLSGQPEKALAITNYIYKALQSEVVDPFVITFAIPCMALAAAFTGKFQAGIRVLVTGIQAAQASDSTAVELALHAHLGGLLAVSGRYSQARYYLEIASDAPQNLHMPISKFWTERNMAYLLYKEGQIDAAYERLQATLSKTTSLDHTGAFYHAPWILDMMQALHFQGYPLSFDYNYESRIQETIQGPNPLLKGVGFRLKAIEAKRNDVPVAEILEYLEKSRTLLEECGGRIEHAKTLTHIARAYLGSRQSVKAKDYVAEAWKIYSQTAPTLFPPDLKHLVDIQSRTSEHDEFWPQHEEMMSLFTQLNLAQPANEAYLQLVALVCSFLGCEWGGVFEKESDTGRVAPVSIYNFPGLGNSTSEEQRSLSCIEESIRTGKSMVKEFNNRTESRRMELFLPFEEGENKRTLYLGTAYPCLTQTCSRDDLLKLAKHVSLQLRFIVTKLVGFEQTRRESIAQLTTPKDTSSHGILCSSDVMETLLKDAATAARLDVPILILGETGVGKDMMAHYIHEHSLRNQMPFVTVDMGSVSDSLIESELFGHERGAFTGAEKKRIGSVALADQGTLFIDEIGEIPLSMQIKLLRVLQEKTFKPLGGIKTHSSDFRLVAATNRDLKQDIKKGRFREDLYHRLNVIPLTIPSLHERKEDIMHLAQSFLERFARQHNRPTPELDHGHQVCMNKYLWPGNIRELKNLMERVVVMQDTSIIEKVLPDCNLITERDIKPFPANEADAHKQTPESFVTLTELQTDYIKRVLRHTNYKISGPRGAEEILGINRSTLYHRMKKLGIIIPRVQK